MGIGWERVMRLRVTRRPRKWQGKKRRRRGRTRKTRRIERKRRKGRSLCQRRRRREWKDPPIWKRTMKRTRLIGWERLMRLRVTRRPRKWQGKKRRRRGRTRKTR